jgi:hypothetical protein
MNFAQAREILLGETHKKASYTDAYDNQTVTPKDLFASFVKQSVGLPVPQKHDEHLQLLNSQALTHKIFSAAYELIAQEYVDHDSKQEISIDVTKHNQITEHTTPTQK